MNWCGFGPKICTHTELNDIAPKKKNQNWRTYNRQFRFSFSFLSITYIASFVWTIESKQKKNEPKHQNKSQANWHCCVWILFFFRLPSDICLHNIVKSERAIQPAYIKGPWRWRRLITYFKLDFRLISEFLYTISIKSKIRPSQRPVADKQTTRESLWASNYGPNIVIECEPSDKTKEYF